MLDTKSIQQIQQIIDQRAKHRAQSEYARADQLLNEIKTLDSRVRVKDFPRNEGGGSTWFLDYIPDEYLAANKNNHTSSILQKSHQALGYAVHCANAQRVPDERFLNSIVSSVKDELHAWKNKSNVYSVETTLRGRKAADAAFWFSIAGVQDPDVFELLTDVCIKEIKRFGSRSSCRVTDILNIVEQLAAAGVRNRDDLVQVATEALRSKGMESFSSSQKLVDLHHPYVGLRLWKFSTRQRKQKSFLDKAARHWEAKGLSPQSGRDYSNPSVSFPQSTKPLIVDIGCGMGVSLLGLAEIHTEHNLFGVDLSGLAIGYANGISSRRNLDHLSFYVDEAVSFLQSLDAGYEGPIEHILIQFPTPFRLPTKTGGNSQLPMTAMDGFMVSADLLHQCRNLLSKHNHGGTLLLQSNCEDVAVYMRQLAEDCGFRALDGEESFVGDDTIETERTLRWIEMGGERAKGPGWRMQPVLPAEGRTETEISCILNKTPVHRCILTPGK